MKFYYNPIGYDIIVVVIAPHIFYTTCCEAFRQPGVNFKSLKRFRKQLAKYDECIIENTDNMTFTTLENEKNILWMDFGDKYGSVEIALYHSEVPGTIADFDNLKKLYNMEDIWAETE